MSRGRAGLSKRPIAPASAVGLTVKFYAYNEALEIGLDLHLASYLSPGPCRYEKRKLHLW